MVWNLDSCSHVLTPCTQCVLGVYLLCTYCVLTVYLLPRSYLLCTGSAPVLSLGYMCQSGWRRAALNPSRSAVTLREYRHRGPEQDATYGVPQPLARSPTSADHVDILGNHELLRDVLAIVSGGAVEERLVSDVEGIAARVDARISRAITSAASRMA